MTNLKSFLNIANLTFMTLVILTLTILVSACRSPGEQAIDLQGTWNFRTDPHDVGESEKWFLQELSGEVELPGSMASNGLGNEITLETQWTGDVKAAVWHRDPNYAPFADPENIRFPFGLQPVKKYLGAAWYQRKISIPGEWTDKRILLFLERPHWQTTVWVNGTRIGSANSLATPHRYDLTAIAEDPGSHTITIRIDNRLDKVDVGHNSHSVTDHTQTNWNGIAGKICLKAEKKISIDELQIFPDVEVRSLRVRATIQNGSGREENGQLVLSAGSNNAERNHAPDKIKKDIRLAPGTNELEMDYPMGEDALLWDEFQPNLYTFQAIFRFEGGEVSRSEVFGLRKVRREGNHLTMNGRRLFLRGTLECAIFPLSGYPSTRVADWQRIFRIIGEHGLNHVRFHSWCPPEAAFIAADQAGIYLQVECSSWANQTTTLGDGKPIDDYILEESRRIVREYGNHPSFCLMAYGNEPGGPNHESFLSDFVKSWKERDNRRIYTSAAGWPAIPENDYHNIPDPRIQRWGEGLNSIINAEPPKTGYDWTGRLPGDGIPVVSHEIGQWCVYPNFNEMEKYTGVLKARNFEIFRESLHASQMGHLADRFLMASGKLQALCYKADIEAALRTPGLSGFQLLDLHDFPGQGTALVGILDPFWDEKGYISPEEYSRFCNEVVPLVRLDKMIYTQGEEMTARVEAANFSAGTMASVNPVWNITGENGRMLANGTLGARDIPVGNGINLGIIRYRFPQTGHPEKITLEVKLSNYANSWDLWIYPPNKNIIEDPVITVVEKLDEKTRQALERGESILLSLGKGRVKEGQGGETGLGFSSIFWNTVWTRGQKPHTLGILCDPGHPALEGFPTEYHSNWQWWDAMSHAGAIRLDDFPATLKPIVRIIDDWVTNRRLALLFEARVENGRILVSGTDLINGLENRPEARQLLSSLSAYMQSEKFNPRVKLDFKQLAEICK